MMKSFLSKIRFDTSQDRLGPDCPFTHWKLYFESSRKKLCTNLFYRYGMNADFRAGAYAVNCSKISLGENVIIRPQCMLFGDPRGDGPNIIIKNNVMMGSGVHIYVANHKFNVPNINIINQGHSGHEPVILEEGCWIGANTIILPGVIIGRNAVVAAGSIVTKSIPDRVLCAGNPAKILKKLD